jgi:hypothetical protein
MRIIANETVGAGNPSEEDSRRRLLEIYEQIRARLAREHPAGGVCPRTQTKWVNVASHRRRNWAGDANC